MATPRVQTLPCTLHPVYIATTLEASLPSLARAVGVRHPVICTERKLARLLAPSVGKLSVSLGGAPVMTFLGGERHKGRGAKERLEDALFQAGADRGSILVSVGGGVVSDLVGFTASTYMRGIPYLGVPTTLLGMVDAALGGKTAVDTPGGKNLIGAFHPPSAVFVCLDLLATLPPAEFRGGLAECLKHGLFMDRAYWGWLAGTDLGHLREDRADLAHLVSTSIGLKCAVVDADPEEASGRRNVLNAGHTVGHALERLSGYRTAHGEAVAAGLLWEAAAAVVQGYLPAAELAQVRGGIEALGFSSAWRAFDPRAVYEAAGADKKNRSGRVLYVPLKAIGEPAFPPPHTARLDLRALRAGAALLNTCHH